MSCTCRVVTDYEPYGNTSVARETVVQCPECERQDLLDNVARLRADLQTVCDYSWELWRMLDQVYDVDNHRMPNEREMPFRGAGAVMEALQALQGEAL
jgi:hypothetical protein